MRRIIPVLIAISSLAAGGCGPGRDLAVHTDDDPPPITPMVKLENTRCGADDRGARAEGELTNVSDEKATFEVVVEFYTVDGAYYTGATITTPPLPPNALATWEAHPSTPAAVGGVCEVVEVYEVPPIEQYDDAPEDGS